MARAGDCGWQPHMTHRGRGWGCHYSKRGYDGEVLPSFNAHFPFSDYLAKLRQETSMQLLPGNLDSKSETSVAKGENSSFLFLSRTLSLILVDKSKKENFLVNFRKEKKPTDHSLQNTKEEKKLTQISKG